MLQGCRARPGQQPQGGAAGLAHGQGCPRQGKGPQADIPRDATVGIDQQPFATPQRHRARAMTQPVKRQGQRRRPAAVFGQHRQGMGLVVLHADVLQRRSRPAQGLGPLPAQIARVAVAADHSQLASAARQQLVQTRLPAVLGAGARQIAQRRRQPSLLAQGQGRGTPEITPQRQHGWSGSRQRQAAGGVATGPAQQLRLAVDATQHRIIEGPCHGPVMQQHAIGNRRQGIHKPGQGLGQGVGQGLAAAVAAGGHQGHGRLGGQQPMQG